MSVYKWALVSDFDGTISTFDVGDALALRFKAATKKEVALSYSKGIPVEKWMAEVFSRLNVSKTGAEKFIRRFVRQRKGFGKAVAEYQRRKLPVEIVSGGLDIYIKPLLKKWQIRPSALYCGVAVRRSGGFKVSYPALKGRRLDDFKAFRVKVLKRKGYKVVFCGDGGNDFKAAMAADRVFARGRLWRLCKTKGVAASRLVDFLAVAELAAD